MGQEGPLSKRISVDYKDKTLIAVLKDIEALGGVHLNIPEKLLEGWGNVNYAGKDQEVGRVLTHILKSRGLGISHKGGADVEVVKLDPFNEFKIKTEQVFEFTEKPKLSREGDKIIITFTSKGFCDATVAIENGEGKIIRHIASGVLGENAPEPFQWNSKKQTLIWDGKDDQDKYVDDKNSVTVRVSLGLKPQFEKTLFWSPHKRVSECSPLVRAAPEGIYVCEGQVVDHVRLFDHQGKFIKTIYPFANDKLEQVQGLNWVTPMQTGKKIPLKTGYHQAGYLTSGTNHRIWQNGSYIINADEGQAAFAMAVRNNKIGLVHLKLNRLTSEGTSGGLPLEGPETTIMMEPGKWGGGGPPRPVSPWSAELSPDGKKLYLAGYAWTYWETSNWDCHSVVMVMDYDKNEKLSVFAGSPKDKDYGDGPDKFHCATSVSCDAKGRVYVSDYMNNRIQVFSADGKLEKSIPVEKPAVVRVHQKTGEIYVFSWPVHNVDMIKENKWQTNTPKLTHLGNAEDPKKIAEYPLSLPILGNWWSKHPYGPLYCGEIDSWSEQTTIWISMVHGGAVERGMGSGGDGFGNYGSWDNAGVKGYVAKDGKLEIKYDFGKDSVVESGRAKPAILSRQRLYVNPASEKLYVAEGDSGVMKSVNQLVEISPDTGKTKLVDLPLGTEDLAFDLNGLAYLRTDTVIARYDLNTMLEIPWDYGEERDNHSYGMGAKAANLKSVVITPGHRSHSFWHLGGISVTAKGHVVVTTCNGAGMDAPTVGPVDQVSGQGVQKGIKSAGAYMPDIYPGRQRWGELHIWDKYGKPIGKDVVPGIGHLNGIGVDSDDNIYLLSASRRLIEGKPIDPTIGRDATGTLIKVPAGKSRIINPGKGGDIPIPLEIAAQPKRPIDIAGYSTGWVEGADWLYGGVGFSTPGGCVCWNTRFDLDLFRRSFVPEPQLFSVGVIDGNGNLIIRIGRPGNIDDGKPIDSTGGPSNTRSIGGDELSLMYACYLATHTDKRLFIADAGNARIASVKLGYQTEEKISLKSIPDLGKDKK